MLRVVGKVLILWSTPILDMEVDKLYNLTIKRIIEFIAKGNDLLFAGA